MTTNESQKKKRQQLIDQGLCVHCGKIPPRSGRKTCKQCGEKYSNYMCKWQKNKKVDRQSNGLCSCGRHICDNRKMCDKCAARSRSWYYRRKFLGLCNYCGNPAREGQTRCEECSNKLVSKNKLLKQEVYSAYGGPKCKCCGETTDQFLTIDHINNDGAEHRRVIGRTSILRWLKKNNFPPGYQVLCFNCNIGKRLNNGICPHQEV